MVIESASSSRPSHATREPQRPATETLRDPELARAIGGPLAAMFGARGHSARPARVP